MHVLCTKRSQPLSCFTTSPAQTHGPTQITRSVCGAIVMTAAITVSAHNTCQAFGSFWQPRGRRYAVVHHKSDVLPPPPPPPRTDSQISSRHPDVSPCVCLMHDMLSGHDADLPGGRRREEDAAVVHHTTCAILPPPPPTDAYVLSLHPAVSSRVCLMHVTLSPHISLSSLA